MTSLAHYGLFTATDADEMSQLPGDVFAPIMCSRGTSSFGRSPNRAGRCSRTGAWRCEPLAATRRNRWLQPSAAAAIVSRPG